MADNRKRKRAIRERMERTGEPYTLAAHRHDAERAGMAPNVDDRLRLLDDVTGEILLRNATIKICLFEWGDGSSCPINLADSHHFCQVGPTHIGIVPHVCECGAYIEQSSEATS